LQVALTTQSREGKTSFTGLPADGATPPTQFAGSENVVVPCAISSAPDQVKVVVAAATGEARPTTAELALITISNPTTRLPLRPDADRLA
jgi:hypothetical protein